MALNGISTNYIYPPLLMYLLLGSIFVKVLSLQKQVLWRWHHQNAWVSGRKHFRGFCGKAEFIQSLLSTGRKQLASRFNFTYRYIDDVLSINNPGFENYLGQMFPAELEILSSWVAIFQPRPPMASLFRCLYDMPWLGSRIDVLFWGRRDFQISFSNRDTSRNAWNRHWGSFMVDTGILSNKMKFPSHKC